MKRILYILLPVAFVLGVCSLRTANDGMKIAATDGLHPATNAVYYWRTQFALSDEERAFLKRHNVGRMYLRMYDVIDYFDNIEPNAILQFEDTVPENLEIVPVVFIPDYTVRCLESRADVCALADKIVELTMRMCSWNNITNWHELQLDCDFLESSRDNFYELCRAVKKSLPEGYLLSSTIRLFQLKQAAPPVDCGVLMAYNTDDFRSPSTTNSILNDSTVEKYLDCRSDFQLPLDIALPIYHWNLLYNSEGEFIGITECTETEPGEKLKYEMVPYETIRRTQSLLHKYLHLQNGHYTTILYHLDSENTKLYTDEEIKSIYSH